jgi:hypothetical protein
MGKFLGGLFGWFWEKGTFGAIAELGNRQFTYWFLLGSKNDG